MKIQKFANSLILVVIAYLLWPSNLDMSNIFACVGAIVWRVTVFGIAFYTLKDNSPVTLLIRVSRFLYHACDNAIIKLVGWSCEVDHKTIMDVQDSVEAAIGICTKNADQSRDGNVKKHKTAFAGDAEAAQYLRDFIYRRSFWLNWALLTNLLFLGLTDVYSIIFSFAPGVALMIVWAIFSSWVAVRMSSGDSEISGILVLGTWIVAASSCVQPFLIIQNAKDGFAIPQWLGPILTISLSRHATLSLNAMQIASIILFCVVVALYARACEQVKIFTTELLPLTAKSYRFRICYDCGIGREKFERACPQCHGFGIYVEHGQAEMPETEPQAAKSIASSGAKNSHCFDQ